MTKWKWNYFQPSQRPTSNSVGEDETHYRIIYSGKQLKKKYVALSHFRNTFVTLSHANSERKQNCILTVQPALVVYRSTTTRKAKNMFLKHKTKPYQQHYANERPRSNFLCWETTYNIREKWGRTKFAVRRQWGVPWGQSDIIEASALLPWPSLHYRTGKSTMLLEWCKKENVTKVAKTMHYSNDVWRHVFKKWVEF